MKKGLQLASIARHPLSLIPLFILRKGWLSDFKIGEFTLSARYDDLTAVSEIGLHGEYGYVRSLAFPDDALVLDLGANIGCFAALVFSVRGDVEVHSVEPSPDTSALLMRNRERYPKLRWVIHRVAIAARDGVARFTNHGPSTARKLADSDGLTVRAESFDRFVQHVAGVRRVFLCKMDIEGEEVPILTSASAALSRIDHFIVEVHGPPENEHRVRGVLSAAFPQIALVEGRASRKPVFHAWRS